MARSWGEVEMIIEGLLSEWNQGRSLDMDPLPGCWIVAGNFFGVGAISPPHVFFVYEVLGWCHRMTFGESYREFHGFFDF